jgi:putative transcriptional regulator
MATKTYKSEVLASVHQMMEGFYQTGAIDKKTMREFDESCLIAAPVLRPEEIKAIRESESVSQPVFARYLNVSLNGNAASNAPAGQLCGFCPL